MITKGGYFPIEHYRDGKLIYKGEFKNRFINEGAAYVLNASLTGSLGGAPSPLSNIYMGLGLANRVWTGDEIADDVSTPGAGVHSVAQEFETYDEASRPEWVPNALATPATLEVSDAGSECVFTIGDVSGLPGGNAVIYSSFIMSTNTKNGSGDNASAILIAGTNFSDMGQEPRIVYTGDVLRVGYRLPFTDPC